MASGAFRIWNRFIRFLKTWTLPLGMFAGVGIYLMFHYIPLLSPLKVLAKGAEDYVMPLMVFIQLFTTFCKVNPREMRICRWHIVMISVQLACCLAVALPIHFFPDFKYGIVAQGALVCLIDCTHRNGCGGHCRTAGRKRDHADDLHDSQQPRGGRDDSRRVPAGRDAVGRIIRPSVPAHPAARVPSAHYPFPYGVGTEGVPAESPCGGRAAVRKPCILPLGHFSDNSYRTYPPLCGEQPL